MTAATIYRGPWRRLTNLSADRRGSIHDDEAAQKLGFRGGFVPGSTVATAALPPLAQQFGQRWFDGGWYSITFVSPVYVDEDVREEGEVEEEALALRVVTRDGRLCASGRAGLGFREPWDRARDLSRGPDEVLEAVRVGLAFDDAEFVTQPSDVLPMLDAAGDSSPWYREHSTWGEAIVPPERCHGFALQVTRSRSLPFEGVRGPGMWAQHDLTLLRPLRFGRIYTMREHVADKGRSGRTLFLTYEFEVLDGPEKVAAGRHKVKWLAAD